ncbi:MAG: glycosyltransferase family 39 protein [Candidatus Sumerlaeales bacterium]|nr:glycosyltransferase family 39 protein [Candidatus Sumerlaeales bacterium]
MTRFQAVALTLAILAITLFFRAIFFLHDSPTYFEIATFDLIQLSPFSYLTSKEIGLVPPLYYFPAKFLAICGSEPWLPRIFSFLMGLLTPYAAYLAVMRAFDSPRLAWSTALLLALNPLHVIASCSMTPDAMAILMTYLVISAFFRTGTARRTDWLLYCAAALMLLHIHAGAPWVIAALFVCHLAYALTPQAEGIDIRATRKHRVARVFFYYFVLACFCAPWRIRMDSWVPWHVDYASFWPTLHYLLTAPFTGTDAPQSVYVRIVQCLFFLPILCTLPICLKASRLIWVPLVGCVMSLMACYGYVQIDRTYFLLERDALLVIPFMTMLIAILCAAIPWRHIRFAFFLAAVLFFGTMSFALSHKPDNSIWRELSQIVEHNLKDNTVVAFWPNYTERFVSYALPKQKDQLKEMNNVIMDLDEPARNREILFVLTDSPAEDDKNRMLFGLPGAIATHSTTTLTWTKDNNVIMRAKDVDWPWLRTWYANPIKLALRDTPTPKITQFIFTPSNLENNIFVDDPGEVFNNDNFAWQTPELSFDEIGRRVVWTRKEDVNMILPVCLYPGKYKLRLHADSNLRRFAHDNLTTRTVQCRMSISDNSTSAVIDKLTDVALPFEVTTETHSIPVHIVNKPLLKTGLPKQPLIGIEIYSIRIDKDIESQE